MKLHAGKKLIIICSYTSVLAYGTDKFLSCDNLVAVIAIGAGMSQLGIASYINLVMQNLEK